MLRLHQGWVRFFAGASRGGGPSMSVESTVDLVWTAVKIERTQQSSIPARWPYLATPVRILFRRVETTVRYAVD